MWPFAPSYLNIVAAKQAERASAIASTSPPATDIAINSQGYLNATASEIVSTIQKGEWTASQVVNAFIARATEAQVETNCLTEILFDQARERAKALDEEFLKTGTVCGPLHGVPVSFKEQFDIVGVDTSLGFSQWAHKPATSNADLVDQLSAAGAVILAKTNVPQTMFAFECSNPVWGRTTNPHNNLYTSGGSSGGEGALLAMDGSVIGVGSDIGGSLRIPAAYCGIYSLKPAAGRITSSGAQGPAPGFEGVKTVVGPMARSIDDLEVFSRLTLGVQGRDGDIAPVPFRNVTLPKKLRFGYYTTDGFAKASPACKRAVIESVEALRKQGHECVEFEPPSPVTAAEIFIGLTAADGFKTMLSHLGPDPKEKSLFLVSLGPKLPGFVRSISTWILETFFGDKIFAKTVRAARVHSVHDYMKVVEQRNLYKSRFNAEVWENYKFDGIIAPVQALPQLPHGGCDNYSVIAIATVLYNILDLPVGCLPVTRVRVDDQINDDWFKNGAHGSPVVEAGLYHGKAALYKPSQMKGMPVGVQLVGKRWEEEKVLGMMRVLDNALGERGFGPGSWKGKGQ